MLLYGICESEADSGMHGTGAIAVVVMNVRSEVDRDADADASDDTVKCRCGDAV